MAAYYTFEDLSGASTTKNPKSDNPYHDLIEACENDALQIQQRYETHRTTRNAQQKEKLLAADFPGVTVDVILAKLENPTDYPGYTDPRHCLVFWARPTEAIKNLIAEIQMRVREVVPNLWIMPRESLHMTALEITHSRTAAEIDALVAEMEPRVQEICDFTGRHRARLVRPVVSFDAQAMALSWVPESEWEYTYHHLRRDLYGLASETGVRVESRYVIPSAHLTIGRFVETGDLGTAEGKVDCEKVRAMVERIEEINEWLRRECWQSVAWVVGEAKGLEFRKGALWYGSGGETVRLGQGF